MNHVSRLGAGLFPFVVLLGSQVDYVHVDGLRLLQLGRYRAQAVAHLVADIRDVFAFDAATRGATHREMRKWFGSRFMLV